MSISNSIDSKPNSDTEETFQIENKLISNRKKLNFESESDHSVVHLMANSMNSINKKKHSILNNYEFFINNINKNCNINDLQTPLKKKSTHVQNLAKDKRMSFSINKFDILKKNTNNKDLIMPPHKTIDNNKKAYEKDIKQSMNMIYSKCDLEINLEDKNYIQKFGSRNITDDIRSFSRIQESKKMVNVCSSDIFSFENQNYLFTPFISKINDYGLVKK